MEYKQVRCVRKQDEPEGLYQNIFAEIQDDPAVEACELPLPAGNLGWPGPLLHGSNSLQEHFLPLHHWHWRWPPPLSPALHFPSATKIEAVSFLLGGLKL